MCVCVCVCVCVLSFSLILIFSLSLSLVFSHSLISLFSHFSFSLAFAQGIVCQELGDFQTANQSFSLAVSLNEELSGAWDAWGNYCRHMHGTMQDAVNSSNAGVDPSDLTSPKRAKADVTPEMAKEWAVATMTCYMNSLRSQIDEDIGNKTVARVLTLLTKDDVEGSAAAVMAEMSDLVEPRWVGG
jgi:hypothetical protein